MSRNTQFPHSMLLSTSTSASSDSIGTGFVTPLSRQLSVASSFASTSLRSLELDDDPGACVFNQFYCTACFPRGLRDLAPEMCV